MVFPLRWENPHSEQNCVGSCVLCINTAGPPVWLCGGTRSAARCAARPAGTLTHTITTHQPTAAMSGLGICRTGLADTAPPPACQARDPSLLQHNTMGARCVCCARVAPSARPFIWAAARAARRHFSRRAEFSPAGGEVCTGTNIQRVAPTTTTSLCCVS